MLFRLHHDASFPVLARSLPQIVINRCNIPIINIVAKTYIWKSASTRAFHRGGSGTALKHQADMNVSADQVHSAKTISNPEPSARYDLE